MAVNRNFKRVKKEIIYSGEVLADVHDLSATDLKLIMVNVGSGLVDLLTTITEVEFGSKDPNAIAERILADAPRIVAAVSEAVPRLLSTIIAVASDDLEAIDVIDEWPMPVQVEAAADVFRLTFVDDEGFRKFVGNVAALLQTGNALTSNSAASKSNREKTPLAPPSLADG